MVNRNYGDSENTGMENAGGDCNECGKPVLFRIDYVAATMSHCLFISLASPCGVLLPKYISMVRVGETDSTRIKITVE